MKRRRPVITIDGPGGAGKSTISKLLADRLSFIYLDTGALYRAVAYRLTIGGYSGREEELTALFRKMDIGLRDVEGKLHVFVDGEDVTTKIRTEEMGLLASKVSALPMVREFLLPVQRAIAVDGGIVAEGRDMGTVVFPDAEIKFFLEASVKERAGRRHRELVERGVSTNIQDVERDLLLRDRQDQERSVSPLTVPQDAVIVDSSDKSIQQVIDIMIGVIENHHRDDNPVHD